MPLHHDWLAQVEEAPIDPGLPVIDAHHHLWPQHPRRGYAYMDTDLLQDMQSGHNIIGTVFVQCTVGYRNTGPEHLKPVGEVEWTNAIAEKHARAHPDGPQIMNAIVSHADLLQFGERADETLAAQIAAAPDRFRGIRQITSYSAEAEVHDAGRYKTPQVLMDPTFRKGFACLVKRGLSFDGWMYHTQLPELVDLMRAFPEATVIINHLGGPLGKGSHVRRGAEVFADWQKSIRELAKFPNVYMKLGGQVIRVTGFAWDQRPRPPTSDELIAAMGHYYHAAIDAFSPARCMFESNFPPDKESCGWSAIWNSFKKMAARYTPDERDALFRDAAMRAYRITTLPAMNKKS